MPYLGKGKTSLGINFGTAAVIMRKGYVPDYKAQYEYTVDYECNEEGVPFEFPTKNERWKTAKQSNFSKIPGSPVAYWVSEKVQELFKNSTVKEKTMSDGQNKTGNNERFMRSWWEVISHSVGRGQRWVLCARGGAYRKWYGNIE